MRLPDIDQLLFDQVRRQNDQRLVSAARYIRRGQATLVAGAGLSAPAGLPGWSALLAKAFSVMLELSESANGTNYRQGLWAFRHRNPDRFQELTEQLARGDITPPGDVNLLESGEYIEQSLNQLALSGEAELSSSISRVRLQTVLRQCMKPTKIKSIAELQNSALWNFAGLMLSYVKNGRGIGNVITYNYDNLLECCLREHLRNNFGPRTALEEYCQIHVDRDIEASPPLPCRRRMAHIYHVHGSFMLPGLEDCGRTSNNLILSEESYYEAEKRTYDWIHMVQAQALLNSSCIFSGFSAEDYNFRRLLKSLNPNQLPYQHYILFTINDAAKHFYQKLTDWEMDDSGPLAPIREDVCFLLNYYLSLKENYWLRYRICPIWSTFDDLPHQVAALNSLK